MLPRLSGPVPRPLRGLFPAELLVKGIPRVPPYLEFPFLALSHQHLNPFLGADWHTGGHLLRLLQKNKEEF